MGAYSLVVHRTGSVERSTVTRAELYARARQLGIPGRSRMNKEELARAVKERGRLVQARALERRSSLLATTPAVLRMLAWRSYRVILPLAAVMVSAVLGAATPMVLVDSPEPLTGARAALPTAHARGAPAQPTPVRVAASAPTHRASPSSTAAAPTILLAEASGGSSTPTGSAPHPVDHGAGSPGPPGGESGPGPAVPLSDPQPTETVPSAPAEVPAEEVQEPTDETGVTVCHHGKTITVNAEAVDAHLAHGDTLGACP